MLVGVGERDPSVTVLGKRRPHPLIVAPMAFQRLGHPEGEVETARAAAATGTTICLSTLGTTSAPALAQAVPEAQRWFQLYVFSDRGVTRELVAQAHEHGYEALVVTVDLPVLGVRERELRTSVHTATADAVASAVAAGAQGVMTPADFAALVDPNLSWSDIERFAAESPLPVIVKGVLRPEDAEHAAEHGARGVIVSNHGGRQLDTVLAGADALPAIVDAVGDRLDVLVDGGIRRGTDVLKALALGARAVLVGRPVLWGLALDGAAGAQRVLETLLRELDNALALAGAPRAAELDRSFVATAPWASAGP
jgi:4-hydroxymandelate oxidase